MAITIDNSYDTKRVKTKLREIIFGVKTETGTVFRSYKGIKSINETKPSTSEPVRAGGDVYTVLTAPPESVTGSFVLVDLPKDFKKEILGYVTTGAGLSLTDESISKEFSLTYRVQYNDGSYEYVGLPAVTATEPDESSQGDQEGVSVDGVTINYIARFKDIGEQRILRHVDDTVGSEAARNAFLELIHGVPLSGD